MTAAELERTVRELEDRRLVLRFLYRLERTGALTCPADNLLAAVDDHLKENR